MSQRRSSLNQITNKPLREQVLDALRDAIVHGELKPGQPIVENDLAAQLGISRAPIREALQILNSEGLLETIPYHGTTVRALTRCDIEELYSLRSVLEAFAVSRIVTAHKADDVQMLRQYYEDILEQAEPGQPETS